jgi:DNA-dependent RNA polymerase auxiliary subunit epsilon
VFPPARENWDTLYMEFESENDVNIFFKYAKNLQKNQRLVRYIPHEFYDRYRAMEADAYLLRHSDLKFKTRIKMGINDLVLYKRHGNESWTTVPCSFDLPAVSLTDEHMN